MEQNQKATPITREMKLLSVFFLLWILLHQGNIMALENTSVNLNEEALNSMLRKTGWNKNQFALIDKSDFSEISSEKCRFFAAYNNTVPGAGVMNFVLDDAGRLVASSGDMNGLSDILRTCLPSDAGASLWAELISAFSSTVHPNLVGERDKLTQLGIPGYKPPMKTIENGHVH